MRNAILLLAAAIPLAGCRNSVETLPALGTIERDRLELTAEASEPLVEILAREGEHVRPGQMVVRLDSPSVVARLEGARAKVSAARNRLLELTAGPRQEQILEARARLEGAQSVLEKETREFERVRELVRRQLTSQSTLDQQRAARDRAEAALKEIQAQLTLLLKGTRVEELAQARDALKQAEAELAQAEVVSERMTVRAPRAGVIEALPYRLGERPPTGAPVVVMLADGETYARVYLPERLRARVKAGAAAEVSVDGTAQPYTGRLRYVAAEAAFTPYYALTQEDRGHLSYLAEVTLTEPRAAELPAGIPVEVRFPTSPGSADE